MAPLTPWTPASPSMCNDCSGFYSYLSPFILKVLRSEQVREQKQQVLLFPTVFYQSKLPKSELLLVQYIYKRADFLFFFFLEKDEWSLVMECAG